MFFIAIFAQELKNPFKFLIGYLSLPPSAMGALDSPLVALRAHMPEDARMENVPPEVEAGQQHRTRKEVKHFVAKPIQAPELPVQIEEEYDAPIPDSANRMELALQKMGMLQLRPLIASEMKRVGMDNHCWWGGYRK